MYRRIYVPVDNSPASFAAVDWAAELARSCGATLTLGHVYAGSLHGLAFGGVRDDAWRKTHDELMARGLDFMTAQYLDQAAARAASRGITAERHSGDGLPHRAIIRELGEGGFDLVVLGATGAGADPRQPSALGTVARRVARGAEGQDLVLARSGPVDGPLAVCVDGSARSFAAVQAATDLALLWGRELHILCAYDPDFHTRIFRMLARIAGPGAEAAFAAQSEARGAEGDSGMARIARSQLGVALDLARERGLEARATLLAGKAAPALRRELVRLRPALAVLGRTGLNADEGLDLGAVAEDLLASAPCPVLLTAGSYTPPADLAARESMSWTEAARARMDRLSATARAQAEPVILRLAQARGLSPIDDALIEEAVGDILGDGLIDRLQRVAVQAGQMPAGPRWSPEAEQRLARVPLGFMRDLTRKMVEDHARALGTADIDLPVAEGGIAKAREMMSGVVAGQGTGALGGLIQRAGAACPALTMEWSDLARELVARVPEEQQEALRTEASAQARQEGEARVKRSHVERAAEILALAIA